MVYIVSMASLLNENFNYKYQRATWVLQKACFASFTVEHKDKVEFLK